MLIEIKDLIKTYRSGNIETMVLKGINLSIDKGEFVAIMGRSGAGKSTLLYQMGLLDHPTSGQITIAGSVIQSLSMTERTKFRLLRLGYVFQDYALIPEMSALENVALPLLMQGVPRPRALLKAKASLDRVGLSHRFEHLPSQMSGGEQQRVSISRALAHDPEIIFADEPTANLDSESSRHIIDIFKKLHLNGQTIVIVTHETEGGHAANRLIRLSDGVIIEDKKQDHSHTNIIDSKVNVPLTSHE